MLDKNLKKGIIIVAIIEALVFIPIVIYLMSNKL